MHWTVRKDRLIISTIPPGRNTNLFNLVIRIDVQDRVFPAVIRVFVSLAENRAGAL